MTHRAVFISGAIIMALAVALGAFGAHGLQKMTDARGLANWETAARYQALHGLGLLILALAYNRYSTGAFTWTALCFILGTIIFSGSLYVLVLTGQKWLGAITPIGGTLFIVGWALMAFLHKK